MILHKRDSWCKSQIQKFIECYRYIKINLKDFLLPMQLYENHHLLIVEYSLSNKEYIGLSNSESISSQIDFLLKAYVKFLNVNKSKISALSKLFPYIMTLFFCPDNFYYHFKTRRLICNFAQIMPMLYFGGKKSYIINNKTHFRA